MGRTAAPSSTAPAAPTGQRLRFPADGFIVVRRDPTARNPRRRHTYLARSGRQAYAESVKRAHLFPTVEAARAACAPGSHDEVQEAHFYDRHAIVSQRLLEPDPGEEAAGW
jgi:hypothetical protein